MPLLRVKQKLLKDKVGQYYKDKKYDSKNIQELKKVEIEYLNNVLNKVYEKMDKVQFIVSDMLRGKCMFNKISHINKAVLAIKKEVEQRSKKGQDIQIVEIDNRLSKITTDLVLKIRIQCLVCEFQLALKFNQAQNQIHHKMYQVERSKVYTPITMLYNWNDTIVTQYFNSIENLINERINKDKKGMIQIMNKLKKIMFYKNLNAMKQIPFVNKKSFQIYEKIKKEIDSLDCSVQVSKTALLRAGKCHKEMKQDNLAIKALNQFQNANTQNIEVLLVLGDVLKNLSKYQNAIKYYDKFLKQFQRNPSKFDSVSIQHVKSEKAECLWQLGQCEQSLYFLKNLIKQQISTFGQQSKYTGKTYSDMGYTLQKLGRYKQSIQKYEKSIKIFENINQKYDMNYIEIFGRISQVYMNMGLFSKCLEYLNKSLSLIENIHGKESIEAAQVLLKFGKIYEKMNRLKQAQNYYMKYGQMAQKIVTKQSHSYVNFLLSMVSLNMVMQKYLQAQLLLKKCEIIVLTISDDYGAYYLDVLNAFGFLYSKTGRLQQALNQFQRGIKTFVYANGEGPGLLEIRANIALTHLKIGSKQIAIKLCKSIIEQSIIIFGEQSLETGVYNCKLMQILIECGRNQQGLKILDKIVLMYEKLQVQNNRNVIELNLNGGQLYCRIGNQQKSLQFFKKVLKHYEVTTGIDSLGYANVCYKIGYNKVTHFSKVAEGKTWILKALQLYKKLDNPKIKQIEQFYKGL